MQREHTKHDVAGKPADDAAVEQTADEAAQAIKRAKAENIGRYVAMFIFPLLMVGMMVWGYLFAMHSPTPHNMPVTVVAQTDSPGAEVSAANVAKTLAGLDGNAVEVERSSDAETARQQVIDREAVAAVVVGENTATVYTASAAGASQSSTVQQLLGPVAAAHNLSVTTEDLASLPESDPAGMGAMFMTTAMIMAGYVPLSMTLSNSPQLLLRKRRAVPLLGAWSALIAVLVWFITGPCLHVVGSEHAGAVLGVTWLGVFAVSMVQMFLTRIVGPMAVLVGMFLLMVLGIPASNMSISLYSTPGFYHILHSFLPAPAIGESLRSVMYFGGHGAASHIWVLVIGAVLGLALTALVDWSKAQRGTRPNRALVNVPSLHGGPRPKSRFWQYAALLFFPLAMVLMMITAMLGTMHSPTPKDMPVAVAGASVEQAEQTVDALSKAMSGMFDFSIVDSAAEAREQVVDRDVAGAFLLPETTGGAATVVVNQSGGVSTAQTIDQAFTQVAQAQHMEVNTDDLAPLPGRDSMGTVSLYIALGWMMAGFLVIVVGANAQPASRPLRRLLPVVAGYSVFMSAVIWLIAGPIVGAVSGHVLEMLGIGIVAIFSVAMFATVLERLFGLLGVVPIVGIIMFLGIPASGGALSIYMEPALFIHLHEVLPMAAAVESARSMLYFGSDVVGRSLLTFVVWAVVSLLVVMLIDRLKPVRTTLDVHYESLDGSSWARARDEGETEGAEPVDSVQGPSPKELGLVG